MTPISLRSVAVLGNLVLASVASFSCGHPGTSRSSAAPVAAAHVAPPAARMTGWSYEIVASPRAEVLAVDAAFPPGTRIELSVGEGAEAFVRDVVVHDG